jgi:hypothetical protein
MPQQARSPLSVDTQNRETTLPALPRSPRSEVSATEPDSLEHTPTINRDGVLSPKAKKKADVKPAALIPLTTRATLTAEASASMVADTENLKTSRSVESGLTTAVDSPARAREEKARAASTPASAAATAAAQPMSVAAQASYNASAAFKSGRRASTVVKNDMMSAFVPDLLLDHLMGRSPPLIPESRYFQGCCLCADISGERTIAALPATASTVQPSVLLHLLSVSSCLSVSAAALAQDCA